MGTQSTPSNGDLFYASLIGSYVDDPQYVERGWLTERIETALADPGCRFLLLTAEPGAGKSACLAGLAHQHPDWPRTFIRRDQVSPLGSPGARAFLLRIGLQLAAVAPWAFASGPLEITIRQRVGTLTEDASAVGAEVKRLIGSPFRRAALAISQEVERAEGRLTGLRVEEWISDPHLIPLDDLPHLALLDPAITLLREAPERRIVILVDALAELRFQDREDNLLSWLWSPTILRRPSRPSGAGSTTWRATGHRRSAGSPRRWS